MQALMMRSEWFAVGRSGAEGPREEHFLWPRGPGLAFFVPHFFFGGASLLNSVPKLFGEQFFSLQMAIYLDATLNGIFFKAFMPFWPLHF